MSDSEYYIADEEDMSSVYSNDSITDNGSNNDINFEYEYLTKQQKTIQELFQLLGFISIDDIRILSGDTVAKALEKSCETIVKIRQDALLLFGFKTRAKKHPISNLQ
ncbi:4266_t:CDS:1 [Diversispora eburnea]|uniref:4266_t:CDS:1 n=1 Tax=Diversispora eburnea TaxID=1213867 RepID=A0A9N9A6G1_9GLOM|nr:4266_t:CDS:1 [Diversispora eburnea]